MILRHRDWESGWHLKGDQASFCNDSLPVESAPPSPLPYLLGRVAEVLEILTPGPVRVLGASGIEPAINALLATRGCPVAREARQVLDLSSVVLAEPSLFKELPEEATIVCMVHPERPPQSLDVYSTIHRHSHRVVFRLWKLAAPYPIGPVEISDGDWVMLD